MIILLSPAKTLDTSPSTIPTFSNPRLLKESQALVKNLKKKSVLAIQELMGVSENIALLNVERYKQFTTPFNLDNSKQAVLLFKGDVYLDLKADTFDSTEMDFAQKHLRILSGLYGILRPLDLMQPYRLEMGTRLKNGSYHNLYEFWDAKITSLLKKDLAELNTNVVLNLASEEYFKAIKIKELKGELVNVYFKENRAGQYKIIAFNAKKARGAMANQIIRHQITEVAHLKDLNVNGYLYNEVMSKHGELVFVKE